MQSVLRDVPLKEVKIKDRFRKDLGDIAGLADSMAEKGLIQPITLDQHMNLKAGERRFRAAERLKWTSIPSIIRQFTDVVDALEVELVENVQRKDLHWTEKGALEKRIYDLKSKKDPTKWSMRDQEALTGTSKSAISRRIQLAEALELIPELGNYKTEDDAWKEYKRLEEDVVRSELYQRHLPHVRKAMDEASTQYIVGDAFKGLSQMAGGSFNFAEVDTPYGVDLDKRKSRNEDQRPMDDYSEWSTDAYPKLFGRVAKEVYRILLPNSFAVFWYGMSWHDVVLKTLRAAEFSVPDIPAIWVKGEAGQTASPNTTLGSCYEPFFLVRKGGPVLAKPGRSNVFSFAKLANTTKDHPTQKPLILMKEIMNTCLMPGARVLIPFLGSGVTLRAAYRLGHTGMGWDMSETYKKAFLKRIAEDQKGEDNGEQARDGSDNDEGGD
jgi:ParB/RepB/Spo0J family partition protein